MGTYLAILISSIQVYIDMNFNNTILLSNFQIFDYTSYKFYKKVNKWSKSVKV